MSLDRYAASAGQHAKELLAELTEQDVQEVRQVLERSDVPDWDDLVDQWKEEALRLLGETPAQWRKRLAKKTRGERIFLTLAAAYLAREAQQLLEQIERNLLEPGRSYRVTTQAAASAAWRLRRQPPEFWPLDDPDEATEEDGDNPEGG